MSRRPPRTWATRPARLSSDEPAVCGPTREVVAVRELELAQHRRHVRLDRLHGDGELASDLLVGVAPCDVAKDFALARRELVELGVDVAGYDRRECVEHEPGEPRREHGVALAHPLDGGGELGA